MIALNFRNLAVFQLVLVQMGWCAAQDVPQLLPEKSYLSCLTPASAERGTPQYPERQLFAKTGGLVRVALTFTGKDSPPRVTILNRNQWNEEAFEDFSRAVERHVAKYRLPCLADGAAVINQDFQFSPDAKKVVAMDVVDSPSEMAQAECKFDYVGGKPVYPSGSQSPFGNVYIRTKFLQRDEPPQVTVVYGGGHFLLAETAKSWAQQYRLRCSKPIERPIETTQTYRFTPPGGVKVVLKDMGFIPFLQSVDRKSLGKPKFDFQTMACPFDVKVTLLQPHAPNVVQESERANTNRKDFMQWLTTLVFNYPDGYERFLVSDTMTVTVPCMVLDLS